MAISKKTMFLLVSALLLLVALFFVFSNFARVQKYFEQQKLESEVTELEKPYRQDTYGGATPEETYALFIKALKEGNIELAAKYFSPKKQADWLEELQAQKGQNTLDEFIVGLPDLAKLEKITSEDGEYIEYSATDFTKKIPAQTVEIDGEKVNLPERHVTYEVGFLKNKLTNKWKIESL